MSMVEGISQMRESLMNQALKQQDMASGIKNSDIAAEIRKNLSEIQQGQGIEGLRGIDPTSTENRTSAPTFGQMLEKLVDTVDAKQKAGNQSAQDLMTGKSDNLHQTMIAMQESGVAFSLLVETRNKVVDGYKELMRMQV